MSLDALEGRSYGPHSYRLCQEKSAEFLTAISAEPGRWQQHAHPGMAAALLFVVAPELLADPALGGAAASILHGDQSFSWHRPLVLEENLEVRGRVSRARSRAGVWFIAFELHASDSQGELLEGSSTFVAGGEAAPPGDSAEEPEPSPHQRAANDPALPEPLPRPGEPVTPLRRSASRADLVRYAAATRDWNPIHWDHEAARAAGLPGVVAHGLLQAAWLCDAAVRHSPDPAPLAAARIRFRSPLRPARQATISGEATPGGGLSLTLSDEAPVATAAVQLREVTG